MEDDMELNDMDGFSAMTAMLEAAQVTLNDSEKANILEMAKQMYEQEMGISVPQDELTNAFESLNIEVDNDNENDDDDERIMPLTEEELRNQVTETFDNIRKLGASSQSKMVNFVCERFKEWNGVEPNVNQVTNIFDNIKETFGNVDKNDNLSEFNNISLSNKLTKEQEEMALSLGIEQLYSKDSGKTSQELRNFARSVVKQDLQEMARQQFLENTGREPTKEEFVEILVQLVTETFVDDVKDVTHGIYDAHVNDEDRDEKQESLQGQQSETEKTQNEVNDKVVLLTTPVEKVGKTASRVDFYAKDQNSNEKLIKRSLKTFEKVHHRQATPDEKKHIKKFVTIEGTLLENQFGNANENENENENKNHDNNQNVNNQENESKDGENSKNMNNDESEMKSDGKQNEEMNAWFSFVNGFSNGKNDANNQDAFAAILDDDDDSDSDYVPPSNESEDCTDDDIEDYIDASAEDRPLV